MNESMLEHGEFIYPDLFTWFLYYECELGFDEALLAAIKSCVKIIFSASQSVAPSSSWVRAIYLGPGHNNALTRIGSGSSPTVQCFKYKMVYVLSVC